MVVGVVSLCSYDLSGVDFPECAICITAADLECSTCIDGVTIEHALNHFLMLLGNCFWREGFEGAFGPERRGVKGGCGACPVWQVVAGVIDLGGSNRGH